jgi:hypothetical protein
VKQGAIRAVLHNPDKKGFLLGKQAGLLEKAHENSPGDDILVSEHASTDLEAALQREAPILVKGNFASLSLQRVWELDSCCLGPANHSRYYVVCIDWFDYTSFNIIFG